MNTTITTMHQQVRKSLIIGLAVLGLAGSAFAVQAQEGRHGQAANSEQRQAKWAEHAAKRSAKLHDSLKLTPAQEPAWTTFVAANNAAHPGAMAARADKGERASWQALPAPARMEKRIAMAKTHIATMETRLAALNTFYAVLTPEQKKLFDDNSKGRGHGKGHGRHGGRGHHGMAG